MAHLKVHLNQILENIEQINTFLSEHNIKWSLIAKVLGGEKKILKPLLSSPIVKNLHSIGDSRLYSLKIIKSINPNIKTMYIAPPAVKSAKDIVQYADITLNSTFEAIEALNTEAGKLGKIHEIIIMIELGELREGILREDIIDFYSKVFVMDNIKVIGLGTNLGCMYGVMPTQDKLVQLSLYKQLLELRFNKPLPLISGGSSITLPLVEDGKLPGDVNHFRIGEAAFLGTTPFDNSQFMNLHTNAFEFASHILELREKDRIPDGTIGEGNVGHTAEIDPEGDSDTGTRAIVDFGLIDVEATDLQPKEPSMEFAGTTSDLTVFDISESANLEVGDLVKYQLNYTAVARLMTSKFVKVEIT